MTVATNQLPHDVWLVQVNGRIDQTLTPQIEQNLVDLLAQGHHRFIVDLSDATYINSGGLRALVSAWRQARQHNGDIFLCGLNKRLSEIFSMVGFDKVFHIYTSREEASRAFDAGTPTAA